MELWGRKVGGEGVEGRCQAPKKEVISRERGWARANRGGEQRGSDRRVEGKRLYFVSNYLS